MSFGLDGRLHFASRSERVRMCRAASDPSGGRVCPGPATPEHRNATRRARYAAVKLAAGGTVREYKSEGNYKGRAERRKLRDAAVAKVVAKKAVRAALRKPAGPFIVLFDVPIPTSAISPMGDIDPTKITDRAARDAFVRARGKATAAGVSMTEVSASAATAKRGAEAAASG